jgi:hypothetical protein
LFWIQGPKLTTQVEGNKISVEKPAALSERLKTIKIECEEVEEFMCCFSRPANQSTPFSRHAHTSDPTVLFQSPKDF